MAAKFDFKNNMLELDIAGKSFKIDATSQGTFDAIKKFRDGTAQLAEELQTVPELDMGKFVEKQRLFLIECINDTLGDSAAESIFEGRGITYFDAMDVAKFVFSEIPKHINNKTDELNASTPANRAQKRAAAKTTCKNQNESAD